MKIKLLIFTTFICAFLFTIEGRGQQVSDHIEIMTYTDGHRILLRWLPTDHETWLKGNEHGYRVERILTHENDSFLDLEDIRSSRQLLFSNLKPYSKELWSHLFEQDSTFAHIAMMTLYEPNPQISNPSSPTFADALEVKDNNEIRHIFGLFAADQDFEIARYMALGYEDPCVEGVAFTYQYIVSIADNDTSNVLTGYSGPVSLRDTTEFPIPYLVADSEVKRVAMSWFPEDYLDAYGSYDIERSSDGIDFSQINNLPFVHLADEDNEGSPASYFDSLMLDESAYYRIIGRTPFGLRGPPSNVVMGTGLHPRSRIFISIDTAEFTLSDTQATIKWNSFDSSWEPSIIGFRVYISDKANEGYSKLSEDYLSPTARSIQLPSSIYSQYVKLEVRDIHGYDYYSVAHLVQPVDQVPPEMPEGLTGKYITQNRIELAWIDNVEKDLKGYRVFVSNGPNKTCTEITKTIIRKPIYYYDVNDEIEIDSIYFELLASDLHENYSVRSERLALPRPDKIPPDPANLYRVEPGLDGIELAWRFSSADDRTRHLLQRRLVTTPLWVNVIEIPTLSESDFLANLSPSGNSETNFIDTATLNIMEYQYRMLAYDDNDNMSSSQPRIVVPYDDGLRGEISDLVIWPQFYALTPSPDSVACLLTASTIDSFYLLDTIYHSDIRALEVELIINETERDSLILLPSLGVVEFLIQRLLDEWGANMALRVNVRWSYDKMHALDRFKIYRSVNSSPLQLYQSLEAIPVQDHLYFDVDVRSEWTCDYSIMATHRDGGFSEFSPVGTVIIPDFD